MMKKIICIGDSTALPGHLNMYEDTWIHKIKSRLPNHDFITVFRRAITTDILITEGGGNDQDKVPYGADCLEYYMPQQVIIQLGIVDCAPRLFLKSSLEFKLVSKLPEALRKLYISFIKKVRGRSQKRVDVPIERFESNIRNFIQRCESIGVEKVIIIGIPYPEEKMVNSNPLITQMVDLYNQCFERMAKSVQFTTLIHPLDSRQYKQDIFEDGYHPNKFGHQIIADQLLKEIGQ